MLIRGDSGVGRRWNSDGVTDPKVDLTCCNDANMPAIARRVKNNFVKIEVGGSRRFLLCMGLFSTSCRTVAKFEPGRV
jgi:hypothetical protein